MELEVLTKEQDETVQDMITHQNLNVVFPVGSGKKVTFKHFLMYLHGLLDDIFDTVSVVIVIDRQTTKHEWLQSFYAFKDDPRFNINDIFDNREGKLNIHLLNAYKLPKVINCDFFVTDIISFRLLSKTTVHSSSKFILLGRILNQNEIDILHSIFGTSFVVSDHFTQNLPKRRSKKEIIFEEFLSDLK